MGTEEQLYFISDGNTTRNMTSWLTGTWALEPKLPDRYLISANPACVRMFVRLLKVSVS
jgi:hypothetical protein